MTARGTTWTVPARRTVEPMAGAYFWLFVFMVVFCLRPEDWVPGLHVIPVAKVTGGLALAAFLIGGGPAAINRLPREIWYLLFLFAWLVLSIPFAFWRGGTFSVVVQGFSKVVFVTVVLALTATTLVRLRRLIFVQAASVALLTALAVLLIHHVDRTGRLIGVTSSDEANANDFATSIVIAFPFCLAFLLQARSALKKAVWAAALAVMGCGLILTASRAGLLQMIVTAAVCLWEFGVKGRRQYLLLIAAVGGLAVLVIGGARLKQRFAATFNPNQDAAAYGSTQLREQGIVRALELTARHPMFGIGAGNFNVFSGTWHEVHDVYLQLSSEGGVPALVFFVLMLTAAAKRIREAKKLALRQPEIFILAQALRASFIGFLVGAAFNTATYQFYGYFLVGYASALYSIASASQSEPASDEPRPEFSYRFKRPEAKDTRALTRG